MIKIIKYILRNIDAYVQNIFRTKYDNDITLTKTINVSIKHQETFGKYKGCYADKEVAIIATAPSLNNYKPIKDVINVGVNRAFLKDDIKLDYIFMQDYSAVKSYMEDILQDKYKDVVKFYGVCSYPRFYHQFGTKDAGVVFPESTILRHRANKFYLYSKYPLLPVRFNVDIDNTWIADCGSIALSAAQFALFTNPKKIYLVGCDCTSGYFNGQNGNNCDYLIKPWKELKKFADIYYPETEIVSVNPVGLKGVFTDLVQE